MGGSNEIFGQFTQKLSLTCVESFLTRIFGEIEKQAGAFSHCPINSRMDTILTIANKITTFNFYNLRNKFSLLSLW